MLLCAGNSRAVEPRACRPKGIRVTVGHVDRVDFRALCSRSGFGNKFGNGNSMCQMHWEQRANVQLSLPGLRRSERGTSVGVEPPCPARVNEAARALSSFSLRSQNLCSFLSPARRTQRIATGPKMRLCVCRRFMNSLRVVPATRRALA